MNANRQRTLYDPCHIYYSELLRMYTSHLKDDIELIHTPEVPPICRDPDDDKVIATAIYGLVDFILTVDRDLLTADVADKLSLVGIRVISADALLYLLDISAEG